MKSMKGMQGTSYTRAFPVSIAVHLLAFVLLWVGLRMMPAPVKELEYIECQMVECEPEPRAPEKKIEARKPEPTKTPPPKPETPKPRPVAEAPRPEPAPVPKTVEAPAPVARIVEAPAPVVAAPAPRPSALPAPAAPPAPPVAKTAPPAPPAPAVPEVYESGAAGVAAAVLVHKIEPAYPMFERRNEIEGKVGVKFVVLEDGTVGDVQIIKPSGSKNFDESAMKAVNAWKFKPAQKGGKSVRMLIKQYVVFRLDE